MAEELDGFELALLDAYRDATAPDPRVEDALLARVLAEVRGEQLDESDEDHAAEAKRERRRDARPITSTAIAITAFAAGLALAWGIRGSVLQPLPSTAPSSAPMQYGEEGRPQPYVDTASLPTCVDRTPDEAPGGAMADLGSDVEPLDEPPSERAEPDWRQPSDEDEPSEPDDASVPAGQTPTDDDEYEPRFLGSTQIVAMAPTGDDDDDRGRRRSSARGSGGWSRWNGGSSNGAPRTRTPTGPGDSGDSPSPSGRPSGKPSRGDGPSDPRPPSPEPGPHDPGNEPPPEPTPKPEPPPEPKPDPGDGDDPNDSHDPGAEGETGTHPDEMPPDAQCDYEFNDCLSWVEAYCLEQPAPEVCFEVRYNSCQYNYEACLQGGYPPPEYDPCTDYIEGCFADAEWVCAEYPEDPQLCADVHAQCDAIVEECYASYEDHPDDPTNRLAVEEDF